MKIKRKKISKKIVIGLILACVIVGSIAYVVFAQQKTTDKKSNKPITYSGPTEQDKKDAEDENSTANKREDIENAPAATSSNKKQVTPVITNASQSGQQITVNSYVSGIFEDGGTCTMTATKGSSIVTKTSKAFADATTTSCAPIFVDRSAFPGAGSWNVVVGYSSNSAEGKSQNASLMIQ